MCVWIIIVNLMKTALKHQQQTQNKCCTKLMQMSFCGLNQLILVLMVCIWWSHSGCELLYTVWYQCRGSLVWLMSMYLRVKFRDFGFRIGTATITTVSMVLLLLLLRLKINQKMHIIVFRVLVPGRQRNEHVFFVLSRVLFKQLCERLHNTDSKQLTVNEQELIQKQFTNIDLLACWYFF